jgi:large subunit ribosomal protein L19
MSAIDLVEKSQLTERPDMKSGDTVRVHVKVREGDKERIQIFEGIVTIAKVDLVRSARVRRAKLYYLRELKGKAARMKETKRT